MEGIIHAYPLDTKQDDHVTHRRDVKMRKQLNRYARARGLHRLQGMNTHWHRERFYFCCPRGWWKQILPQWDIRFSPKEAE